MKTLGLNAFHADASGKACPSHAFAQERMVFEALLARLLAGSESASRIPS